MKGEKRKKKIAKMKPKTLSLLGSPEKGWEPSERDVYKECGRSLKGGKNKKQNERDIFNSDPQ